MGLKTKIGLGIGVVLVLLILLTPARLVVWTIVTQPQMWMDPELDQTFDPETELPADLGNLTILSFSKTNGFRHHEAIEAQQQLLDELAQENGWTVVHSENGAIFQRQYLQSFHAVILNNKTGHTWNDDQRAAFRDYVEEGGSVLVLHAAGDASNSVWPWYTERVVRAEFTGHPMRQHIQEADLIVEDRSHPATAHLPPVWRRADEWYNFAESPRDNGTVLISIDENTYDPEYVFIDKLRGSGEEEDTARALAQAAEPQDHPLVWWHREGDGRILYSALGHTKETYAEPAYREFLAGAIVWALN